MLIPKLALPLSNAQSSDFSLLMLILFVCVDSELETSRLLSPDTAHACVVEAISNRKQKRQHLTPTWHQNQRGVSPRGASSWLGLGQREAGVPVPGRGRHEQLLGRGDYRFQGSDSWGGRPPAPHVEAGGSGSRPVHRWLPAWLEGGSCHQPWLHQEVCRGSTSST